MTLIRRFKTYRKRLRRLWLTLSLLPLLAIYGMTAGCVRTVTVVDHCTGWEAIYVSGQDVLTDQTAKQIQAHDEHGVTQNCWNAPKKKGP